MSEPQIIELYGDRSQPIRGTRLDICVTLLSTPGNGFAEWVEKELDGSNLVAPAGLTWAEYLSVDSRFHGRNEIADVDLEVEIDLSFDADGRMNFDSGVEIIRAWDTDARNQRFEFPLELLDLQGASEAIGEAICEAAPTR